MTTARKTLSTSFRYRFQDGTTARFTGKTCYRLSNSWNDAQEQAGRACVARGETFDPARIIGPDSGLSDEAVRSAAQDLYAVVFADAWEEAGGRFYGGTSINDVVPAVSEAGVHVVRSWIDELDHAMPYPIVDLFNALGADEDQHGDGLYYLCMGSIGHGVGFEDWVYDRGLDEGAAIEQLGSIDPSPINLDDWQLREIADEWVERNPPDADDPYTIPTED